MDDLIKPASNPVTKNNQFLVCIQMSSEHSPKISKVVSETIGKFLEYKEAFEYHTCQKSSIQLFPGVGASGIQISTVFWDGSMPIPLQGVASPTI